MTEIYEGEVLPEQVSLVRQNGNDLVLSEQSAQEKLAIRAKSLAALRKLCIQALTPDDFHMFGDNPWIEESGVSKITSIYGVSFGSPTFEGPLWRDERNEETGEIKDRGYYIYRCTMTAHFALDGRSYTATGTADTRQGFFQRGGKRLHPLDVDENNVMKKAETNARARCLMGLGLADFTPEELQRAKFDTDKSTGHTYKSAAPKPEPSEKQIALIQDLIGKKMDGCPSIEELMSWILADTRFDKKQASNGGRLSLAALE